MSVSLRRATPADAAWLDAWSAPVAESVGYNENVRTLCSEDGRARVIERDGAAIGVIVCREGVPDQRSATIEFVGTMPAHARFGYGHRGAALLEEQLAASGVETMFAPAPAAHGIAMYFWIRLGYRPLLRAAWPCEIPGVAWLRRDLA